MPDSWLDAVLTEIREAAPVTAAEIARETGIPERNVRRLLAELEETGHIESETYQLPARVWLPVDEQSER